MFREGRGGGGYLDGIGLTVGVGWHVFWVVKNKVCGGGWWLESIVEW